MKEEKEEEEKHEQVETMEEEEEEEDYEQVERPGEFYNLRPRLAVAADNSSRAVS